MTADLKGDAKAKENLLAFVRNLDSGRKNNPLMRSVRGRIENCLPAIERHARLLGLEEVDALINREIALWKQDGTYNGDEELPVSNVDHYVRSLEQIQGLISRELGGHAS